MKGLSSGPSWTSASGWTTKISGQIIHFVNCIKVLWNDNPFFSRSTCKEVAKLVIK